MVCVNSVLKGRSSVVWYQQYCISGRGHSRNLHDQGVFGRVWIFLKMFCSFTALDLDITAGFVTPGSDIPSLPVMSLKIRK